MEDKTINAFPTHIEGNRNPHHPEASGMTLRDYFAAKALNVASDKTIGQEEMVRMAYNIADLMLKERNVKR